MSTEKTQPQTSFIVYVNVQRRDAERPEPESIKFGPFLSRDHAEACMANVASSDIVKFVKDARVSVVMRGQQDDPSLYIGGARRESVVVESRDLPPSQIASEAKKIKT